MSDGLHQVGFPKTNISIDEKRVICLCGSLGHGERGGMGKGVARTYDKAVICIVWIESALPKEGIIGVVLWQPLDFIQFKIPLRYPQTLVRTPYAKDGYSDFKSNRKVR